MRKALILVSLLWTSGCLLIGCSSAKPGGAFLYDRDADPPRLLDSSITMETTLPRRSKRPPQIRTVRCVEGRITASIDDGRERGEGELPFAAYAELWNRLRVGEYHLLGPDGADPTGGYYHVIQATLGFESHRFTAQDRNAFLGFGTKDIALRLELANAIVRSISEHVPTVPIKPESAPAAEGGPKEGGGGR